MSNTQKDNRSASQKIQDLETGVISLFQTLDNVVRDLMTIKEALKLLDNKTTSIISAAETNQPITGDTVSKIMVENNSKELSDKVANWVNQGLIAPSEQVTENSFVVLRELGDDDSIINPRYQFVWTELKAKNPLVCEKILGLKVGETAKTAEGHFRLQVAEVYEITQTQPESAEDAAESEAAIGDGSEGAPSAEPAAPAPEAAPAQAQQ